MTEPEPSNNRPELEVAIDDCEGACLLFSLAIADVFGDCNEKG